MVIQVWVYSTSQGSFSCKNCFEFKSLSLFHRVSIGGQLKINRLIMWSFLVAALDSGPFHQSLVPPPLWPVSIFPPSFVRPTPGCFHHITIYYYSLPLLVLKLQTKATKQFTRYRTGMFSDNAEMLQSGILSNNMQLFLVVWWCCCWQGGQRKLAINKQQPVHCYTEKHC